MSKMEKSELEQEKKDTIEDFKLFPEKITIEGGQITFNLLVPENFIIPSFNGAIVRGCFLNIVQLADPLISETLHFGTDIRPYSTEPIQVTKGKRTRTRRRELIINKDDEIAIKIKFLSNKLLDLFVSKFVEADIKFVEILEKQFPILSMDYKRIFFKQRALSNRLKINFLTPTYFSMKTKSDSMFFPDPNYLFMNIINLWNTFNCSTLVPEVQFFEWIKKNVIINDYSTYTTRVSIQKGTPIKGFKGWVVYRFKNMEKFLPWIDLLLQFSQISNVGGSRTAGFGVIRSKWLEADEKKI
ncbi:MAG: CRISPR system precrRNA processing endoribonuclease RAMP protein Cas6 [Candidatus Heimdallarchaeaceae archaeon]